MEAHPDQTVLPAGWANIQLAVACDWTLCFLVEQCTTVSNFRQDKSDEFARRRFPQTKRGKTLMLPRVRGPEMLDRLPLEISDKS